MAALEESGLSSSTNVAVWSDHGDYAGDYGLVEKWPSGLEDVLTRVPLIVRAPQSQGPDSIEKIIQQEIHREIQRVFHRDFMYWKIIKNG